MLVIGMLVIVAVDYTPSGSDEPVTIAVDLRSDPTLESGDPNAPVPEGLISLEALDGDRQEDDEDSCCELPSPILCIKKQYRSPVLSSWAYDHKRDERYIVFG